MKHIYLLLFQDKGRHIIAFSNARALKRYIFSHSPKDIKRMKFHVEVTNILN